MTPNRRLGGRARRAGDMGQTGRAGDVDPAVDRVDPRGAGIGDDDPGRPEDGETAHDPETGVHRFPGQFLAARDGDLDLRVARHAVGFGDLGDGGGDHPARHRVDRGLAGFDRQPGFGHRADAGPRSEVHAAPGFPDRDLDQRAVGHVGIVACILDHRRRRRLRRQRVACEHELDPVAARQGNRHRILERAGQQGAEGRFRGRGGAGARGPAAAQRSFAYHRIGDRHLPRGCHRAMASR